MPCTSALCKNLLKIYLISFMDCVGCKNVDDWVSACGSVEVTGVKSRGRGRKTRGECVNGVAWSALGMGNIQGYEEGLHIGQTSNSSLA